LPKLALVSFARGGGFIAVAAGSDRAGIATGLAIGGLGYGHGYGYGNPSYAYSD
jgi:hypothetical protein